MTLMMPRKLRVSRHGVRTWRKNISQDTMQAKVLYQLKYICSPHATSKIKCPNVRLYVSMHTVYLIILIYYNHISK